MNDNAMFAFQLQDQTKSLNKTSDQAEFHLSAQQEEVHAGNYRYVFASAAIQELSDLCQGQFIALLGLQDLIHPVIS